MSSRNPPSRLIPADNVHHSDKECGELREVVEEKERPRFDPPESKLSSDCLALASSGEQCANTIRSEPISLVMSPKQPRTQTRNSMRAFMGCAFCCTLLLLFGVRQWCLQKDERGPSWTSSISNPFGKAAALTWPALDQPKASQDIFQAWKKEHSSGVADFWTSGTEDEVLWSSSERKLREIPQYVLDYAPYVHLYSGETYWPCDIAEHLIHTTPHNDYTPVKDGLKQRTLDDLDELNEYGPRVYLQSDDNVEDFPEWLAGDSNIPFGMPLLYQDKLEYLRERIKPSVANSHQGGEVGSSSTTIKSRRGFRASSGGRSDAPAVLIVVDKGDDIIDAFWFFFYSYNLGNTFFSVRFGNHVGDWEHTVVRFHKGEPQQVFFSEHSWGGAYDWGAVEKIGDRPVAYSASGTHAMYGTPGTHEYVLPFGLLYDITDRGPLWDPTLNMHAYTYDYHNDTLRSSQLNPTSPVNWFYFWGRWGDKAYPLSDPRQYKFAGQLHYVSGPLGPRYKRLERKHICQGPDKEPCEIRSSLAWRTEVWRDGLDGEYLTKEEEEYWARRNAEHAAKKGGT